MSIISKEQVQHIAKLAQIPLKNEEDTLFAGILSDTLKTIDVLNELNTSNTLETYQVTGLINVFQSKQSNATTLSQEDALKNAKETERGLISTKGVFTGEA